MSNYITGFDNCGASDVDGIKICVECGNSVCGECMEPGIGLCKDCNEAAIVDG